MKKISVDHLARVEGNGGISATIDGNAVTDVKFTIYEGPRLVERLTVGRTPEEDVSIAPRICAICTLSHKYAAIRAMENALSVEVSPKVYLLRELMHMGEMIESHSLHLYFLALPDYLGYPNVVSLASKYDFEAKIGLEMKNFANHIMKTISARYIHGENPVIGGFGKYPTKEELVWIKSRAIQFMPFVMKTVQLFCELDYPDCPEDETVFACCSPPENQFGFHGEEILLSTGDTIDKDNYTDLTNEFVVPHSYAKHSLYQGKPFSVGALARVNNLGERLEGESKKMYQTYFSERWKKNPLFNNAAQALEILHCFERIPKLVDEILKYPKNPSIQTYKATEGKGTGLAEAPRGLLIHHYEVSEGLVSHTDIITPTAQNAEDIERYCYIAAQKLLDNGEKDKIRDRMDLVVRAYDPCISCSAHMAEVKKAPRENWKKQLHRIQQKGNPVFMGVGKRDCSDDGSGIELALELKKRGVEDVWLESEIEEENFLTQKNGSRPLLFMDAIDFKENPGKIFILPLHYVLSNASLSHRFLPFLSREISYQQLKNSFVLGIQPKSIDEGQKLSPPVRKAMDQVIEQITH